MRTRLSILFVVGSVAATGAASVGQRDDCTRRAGHDRRQRQRLRHQDDEIQGAARLGGALRRPEHGLEAVRRRHRRPPHRPDRAGEEEDRERLARGAREVPLQGPRARPRRGSTSASSASSSRRAVQRRAQGRVRPSRWRSPRHWPPWRRLPFWQRTGPSRTVTSRAPARRRALRITPGSVGRLAERWRYRIRGEGTDFGRLTATPVVVGDTVYLQTWKSNVVALDRRTGRVRWSRDYDGAERRAERRGRRRRAGARGDRHDGVRSRRPDGQRTLEPTPREQDEQFVDIAPVVDRGRVVLRTVGFPPGGRGAVYALDAPHGTRGSGGSRRSPSPGRTTTPAGAGRGTRCRSTRRAASTSASRTPGRGAARRGPERRRLVRGQHALHGLAGRAGRRHRQGRLVRPGARPRRPRLRLPRLADPRVRRAGSVGRWSSAPARPAGSIAWDRETRRAGLGAAGRGGT